jgi:hypothetical protein
MNFHTMRKTMLLSAAAIFVWWAWKAPAQDTATLNAPARVPYAVSQVIELEQAKIGDDTVITICPQMIFFTCASRAFRMWS